MNKWISLLLAVCLVLALAVLDGSASTARAVITVYSQGDWISPDLLEDFSRQTGIEVDYIVSETPPQDVQADVLLADSELLGSLAEQGALAALESVRPEPFGEEIDASFLRDCGVPEGYVIPCLWTSMGLLYNPTQSDLQVTSWGILFDTRFAGQIVMPDRYREAYAVALAALGLDVNSADDDALLAAEEALERQQALVLDRCSPAQLEDYFASGEAVIAPCYAAVAGKLMAENPQLSFIIPNEGSWRILLSYAVAADTDRAGYASQFLDYMCRAEHLARNAAYCGYSTTSTAAWNLLDKSWQQNPLAYPNLPDGAHVPVLEAMPVRQRTRCLRGWAALSGQ